MHSQNYQLIDFGRGRKLERFEKRVLNRPCPAADGISQTAHHEWPKATHRFVDRSWEQMPVAGHSSQTLKEVGDISDEEWLFKWNSIVLTLNASPFGHVGVFPEQAVNWDWICSLYQTTGNIFPSVSNSKLYKPTALNLFAYTGGSTLALAKAGFEVTHVDASKPSVQWARRNAVKSKMSELPIRWIVDDVRDFVKREIRRQQRYDFIVLDPPAFGHGAAGKRWEIEKDLPDLIDCCIQILSDTPIAVVLTGHSPIDSMEFGPLEKQTFKRLSKNFKSQQSQRATLTDLQGRQLDCGYIFRWFNESL